MDDIDRKRERRDREKIKDEVASDISEVAEDVFNRIGDFFKRKQIEEENREKKKSRWSRIGKKILGISWIIILIIITLNFLLGAIWLLKTLLNALF